MDRHARRGTTLGALIATAGLLALSSATLAMAAPIVTDQDLECVYLTGDQILIDDPNTLEPIVGTSTDVPVTLDYTSPADPTDPLDVSVTFGPGITNATDVALDELSLAAYLVTATTEDGITVGAGFTEDDLAFPDGTATVAPGDPLPALPTGDVEVQLSPLAAGRTVYLQPVALFLNGDPEAQEPPPNAVIGQCEAVGDPDTVTRTLDFPVTFTGEALPIPAPGEQEVVLADDAPVSPGDEIDVQLSGFLPGSLVLLQECPVDADPCPDLEDLGLETLSTGGAFLGRADGRAAAVARAATEPDVAFIDDDGTATASIVIAQPDDSGCGPADPCDLVAQDFDNAQYIGRTAITYADDANPTPTPTPTPSETVDESGSTLPDTGAGSAPLALTGAGLLGLGLALVIRSRRPVAQTH